MRSLRKQGFGRLVVDGRAVAFDETEPSALANATMLQVVVDRLKVGPDLLGRMTDSVETAYAEGGGTAFAIEVGDGPVKDAPVVHRFS